MRSTAKIILVNCTIVTLGVILLDVLFGNWVSYGFNYFTKESPAARLTDRYYDTAFRMCPSQFLHHMVCPEISYKTKMLPADGGETIVSYRNKSSIRVAGPDDMATVTDVSSYDFINIGDSFLQTDEISYEYTLSRVIEAATGKRVLEVGGGSWAPINFYAWLKHNQLRHGVEVNMFVMINDVLPNYDMSNLSYHRVGNISESGELQFEDVSFIRKIFGESNFPNKLRHVLLMNSAVYRLFERIKLRLEEKKIQQSVSSTRILLSDLTEPVRDCSRMNEYDDITTQARDYLRLAFDFNCWDEELLRNVDSAVADLRKSTHEVSKVGGKVRVLIVPAAWAFEDEGVVGKMQDSLKMGANTAITSEPLVEYVTLKLSDLPVEVISLEKVIRNIKGQVKENLYFPADLHWNRKAHKILGVWMAENFHH